jgi:hypothetical protein
MVVESVTGSAVCVVVSRLVTVESVVSVLVTVVECVIGSVIVVEKV